ncbi:hypothetical protein RHG97_20350 [Clostridioides difficile]|nr:hypothetical protein [Clostridioides difficile]
MRKIVSLVLFITIHLRVLFSALHDDDVLDSKSLDKLEEYFKNFQEKCIDD